MNEFDEVIFDEDDFLDEPVEQEESTQEPTGEQDNEPEDLTHEVLRLKGIADPEKIKFEDETGAVIERPWNALTKEEQLNILTSEESRNELTNDEIYLLNTIRNSGMSVNDYMNSLQPEPEPANLEIDQLSDEEIYALDLIDRIGSENISDEELEQAINNAKQNEALFKKTVEGIRNEYIKLELDEKAQKENAYKIKQEEQYNQFASSIYNEINDLNSFAGQSLELSPEDTDELAAFMLQLDNNGVSAFGRALQDPALMTKAAFWLLNEQQIVEELTKQMQENYKRGYEAGKADKKPDLVITQKKQPKTHDLVFDDEW